MSNKQRRLRLFDEFSRQIYIDNKTSCEHGIYVCPICFNIFKKDSCENGELTIEHVPPESLGGSPCILTCKNCNNVCGHDLDIYLLRERQLRDGSYISKDRTCKVTVNDVTANVIGNISNNIVSIKFAPKHNPPSINEQFNEAIKTLFGNWDGSSFNLQIPLEKQDSRLARIALLKTAYLKAFSVLGYKYILKECLNPVREQILNYDKDIIRPYYIISNSLFDKIPFEDEKLYQMTINGYMHCVLVVVALKTSEQIDRYLVYLPCDNDNEPLYTYMDKIKNTIGYNLHIEEINW